MDQKRERRTERPRWTMCVGLTSLIALLTEAKSEMSPKILVTLSAPALSLQVLLSKDKEERKNMDTLTLG